MAAAVAGLMIPRRDATPAPAPADPPKSTLYTPTTQAPREDIANCIVREEVYDASLGYCTGYIEYPMYLPTMVYPPPRHDL